VQVAGRPWQELLQADLGVALTLTDTILAVMGTMEQTLRAIVLVQRHII
jgi:hypothetical protein